ncbi:uncharacterized protein At4g18490 isoform X2 [Diospyros lotus]|uniref:uncharacterized protein At4g18490 isoform X2 n=1 Tax=Diospyros lotus TaxID=55363 RepID=UPI002250EF80|nr:uncharacterized protein At4g18490 isoform X2 [Diospyros lotus]
MGETKKGDSSPANSKEKSSVLDVDFGKDFLTSWKSMSVADDDVLDFDFGTVTKGKKKAFNFDKLDVDFSLDDDLDKISSLKVDISDLDISSPPKKAGKNKETSEKNESSSGNHQQKRGQFSFAFDFNELDSFSFETSSKKEGKNIGEDNEEVSTIRECQGSKVGLSDGFGASEGGGNLNLAASEGVITSKAQSFVGSLQDVPINKNFPSSCLQDDNDLSKSAATIGVVASEEARGSPDMIIANSTKERNQDNYYQQEKTTSSEQYSQENMQDLSVQSASENELTQDSALQVEIPSLDSKVTRDAEKEQIVNCKSASGLGLNGENGLLEDSPALHIVGLSCNDGEQNRFETDNNVYLGRTDGNAPAQGDSGFEDIATTRISRESMHDTKASADNEKENAEQLTSFFSSGTSVPKLIQMKEKKTSVIQSKYFKKTDEKESQPQETPPTRTGLTRFSGKTIGSRQQIEEGSNVTDSKGALSGSKLVRVSTLHSGELNEGEPVLTGRERSVRGFKNIEEHINADSTQNGSNLNDSSSSRQHDPKVTNNEACQENEKNVKTLVTLRSNMQNLSGTRLPDSSMVSTKHSNNICDEGKNTAPLKADRSLPDLSSLKISRTIGVKHHPPNSTFPKQLTLASLRNTKQNMVVQGNTVLKIAHSTSTQKLRSPTPSLKRKAFEVSNTMLSLNPSKRLSQSPTDSRTVREPSERVIEKKVCNHEELLDNKTSNISKECQTSIPHFPQEVNMIEEPIPLVMENDDNVGKAEAYSKQLEDICNMLKKKHEEAKELLVRAIVNNNNLLMLNHPLYDEKIRKVQKFAAQLMSKGLRA